MLSARVFFVATRCESCASAALFCFSTRRAGDKQVNLPPLGLIHLPRRVARAPRPRVGSSCHQVKINPSGSNLCSLTLTMAKTDDLEISRPIFGKNRIKRQQTNRVFIFVLLCGFIILYFGLTRSHI